MEARGERENRKAIRAISLHPSGITIKEKRKVMDCRNGMIGWEETLEDRL